MYQESKDERNLRFDDYYDNFLKNDRNTRINARKRIAFDNILLWLSYYNIYDHFEKDINRNLSNNCDPKGPALVNYDIDNYLYLIFNFFESTQKIIPVILLVNKVQLISTYSVPETLFEGIEFRLKLHYLILKLLYLVQ